MKTILEKYQRDNISADSFDNERLLALASLIEEEISSYDEINEDNCREVFEKLDSFEFDADDKNYTIVYNEDENVLYLEEDCSVKAYYDDKDNCIIAEDNYYIYDEITGHITASMGYAYIKIKEETFYDELKLCKEEIMKFLKSVEKFEITCLDSGDYAVGVSCEKFKYEEGDIITQEEAIELFEYILSYIESNYKYQKDEDMLEVPICCNNPYATGSDKYNYEIDEDTLTFKTEYYYRQGAFYHMCYEEIVLSKCS